MTSKHLGLEALAKEERSDTKGTLDKKGTDYVKKLGLEAWTKKNKVIRKEPRIKKT